MSKPRRKPPAEAEPVPVYRGTKHTYSIIKPPSAPKPKSRWLLKLLLLLIVIGIFLLPILAYYYNRYSEIIDQGLAGKIFERSTGIYAAPMHLYVNAPYRQTDVIRHLQNVGYINQGAVANDTRGRFTVAGNIVDVVPGNEAVINSAKAFPALRVEFGPTGYGIRSLTESEKQQTLQEALLEPEKIFSTINKEREKRKNIEFKDLPKNLIDAIVATEDRSFFDHSGISLRAILRAFFRNVEEGEIAEGGSTITQQLVKSFFLTPEQTYKRKLSEAFMAIVMERKLSKEQILTLYCNQIYLGQRGGFSINGFGEAARTYFGKDVNYLTLSESAFLAGMIHSPNYYSPLRESLVAERENRARERRNRVLDLMLEQGKIKPEEAANAKLQPLGVIGRGNTDAVDAPYFVDYVLKQLDEKYREDSQSMRSLRIYTTVDLELQRAAYAAVQKNMPEIDRQVMAKRGSVNGLQTALVALNAKTGEVLAMVGGRDYTSSQFNRATEAKRQPGSVFKPFVYAAGLSESSVDRRITAASIYRDEPRGFDFDGKFYSPDNFKDNYEMRSMTAREALYKSKNVITVSIAERVGYSQVANFAQNAGLPNVLAVPSTALGTSEATPLQMASAYTSFANQGKRAAPLTIKRLTTKDGSLLLENEPKINDVMSPQVAYIMTSMMEDVLNIGTGTRVRQMGFNSPAAGKTGTSRDGWFAGYTPNLVCVVWVGFDNNDDIVVTGGSTAALIWADFMKRALEIRPELDGQFEPPSSGLVTAYITPQGNEAKNDTPGARREIFLSGTETGEAQDLTPTRPPQTTIAGQTSQPPFSGPILGQSAQTTPQGATRQPTPYPPPPGAPPIPQGLAGQTASVSGIDTMIPVLPEARGRVTLGQPTPQPTATPDNRSILGRTRDRALAAVTGKAQPAPSTVSTTGMASTAAPRSTPRVTPTPAVSVRQTPPRNDIRITTAPTVGPTPWPPPRQATVVSTPKPTPDAVRPRRVPTPTPTPKKADVKAVTSKPSQVAKAKASPTPRPVSPTPTPAATPAISGGRKQFNFEVCSVSGLIPVNGVCKTRIRKSFFVGEEPTRTCSADRHK